MPDDPEKKIIIDEGWKAQVEAEREAAARGGPGAAAETAPEATARPAEPMGPLPSPTLSFLVTSLAMQAMAALGVMPDPLSGKTVANLDLARHLIDTLEMLEAKTTGNRTAEENAVLDNVLHELRLGYVMVRDGGGSSGAEKPPA